MSFDSTDRFNRFTPLAARFTDEVITHSVVTNHTVGTNNKKIALITLDNNNSRPATLGPNTLIELGQTIEHQAQRAREGEIEALAIIGKPGCFAAGADLGSMKSLTEPSDGQMLAELGHTALDGLIDFPVPTFAFINGVALGGGLEVALACNYRTVASSAKGLGLPEVHLGLIPGWGGTYRLPHLVGPENGAKIMIENPLNNNRSLKAKQAYELGVVDSLVHDDAATSTEAFLNNSLSWAASILSDDDARAQVQEHRVHDFTEQAWQQAAHQAQILIERKVGTHQPAPSTALELFAHAQHHTDQESAAEQITALGTLIQTNEFSNTIYAFLDLLQKRSKSPAGAPDPQLATPVRKVGVVGAGLMAGQLAQVFATQLHVPVVMTDISQDRVDAGVARVHGTLDKLASRSKISSDQAEQLKTLITGSVSQQVFADADFVIEAVFEEMEVKKTVLTQLEEIVSTDCILASNTSSLSITEMAASLKHPERMVGFHFFNPVAVMPLIELVRGPETTDQVLATAFTLAASLKKTAVLVHDSPAFVVNRVLLRLMGDVQYSFDQGTDAHIADHALDPMGLPMTPFTLLSMVGIPVAQHVTESLNSAFGDQRFPVSQNLQQLIDHGKTAIWSKDTASSEQQQIDEDTAALFSIGNEPETSEQLLQRVQDGLAGEIGLMLDEGVVAGAADIDLCMIIGAGWPLHLGGITPYLDQCGASQRVNGKTFH